MTSDRPETRDWNREQTTDTRSALPRSSLSVEVPNDQCHESVVALVQRVLVELTYADVGAEYRSQNVWGVERIQYAVADSVGETFTKLHYDERLGWHTEKVTREELRYELIYRLTRPSSFATNRSHSVSTGEPDCVKALWKL